MNLRNRLIATVGATALLVSTAVTGLAADSNATVKINENAGDFSVSISSVDFGELSYNFDNQLVVDKAITVTVKDNRGSAPGWNVSLSGGAFTDTTINKSFASTNLNLEAASPAITYVGGNTNVSGQTALQAPFGVSGTATKIWSAGAGSGDGEYKQNLLADLTVPGGTLVGNYTSTLTVNIASGPGN